MKVANFQLRFWEKNFRGLNVCAKTLIFGILTLDRLFLKRYAAIFLILIFFACRCLPKLFEMTKISKNHHFLTSRVQKWDTKSNYQKFSDRGFEEPYEDATCKVTGNFDKYCSLYFFSSNFSKHFLSRLAPKILDFASQIWKNDDYS